MTIDIRPVVTEDLPGLLQRMRAHAAHERARPPVATEAALRAAILGSGTMPPRLLAWVAIDGDVIGYLTATHDFSTWRCAPFLHMDCLYVDPEQRGRGVGAALFDALCRLARQEQIDEIQWQTPDWNRDAARFYRRLGATDTNKLRFTWPGVFMHPRREGVEAASGCEPRTDGRRRRSGHCVEPARASRPRPDVVSASAVENS